jgi:hypothetical protein
MADWSAGSNTKLPARPASVRNARPDCLAANSPRVEALVIASPPSCSIRANHSAGATSAIFFAPVEKLVRPPAIACRATFPSACIVPRPTSRSCGLSRPWMQ